MSFTGGSRIMYSSLVVLLIISVLQIWVCCDCKAGAIRIFPGNSVAKEKVLNNNNMKDKMSKEELYRKYFNGRAFDSNRSEKGFAESKRKIPSCPDPLHNK